MSDKKPSSLDKALAEIDKVFGKGSIFTLTGKDKVDTPVIPTGIPQLDNDVLGIGGLPRGRIVEVYGPESSGKTTTALTVVSQAQILIPEKRVAYIDVEHALDPKWMVKNKVNLDALLVSQPDSGEQALKIADAIISSGECSLLVVDSVAALVPEAELNGDIGDAHVGLLARLMAQALRILVSKVSDTGTCLLFINQIREKIGSMGYGEPTTTPGGRALKFYSSVRLDVRRIGHVKQGEEIVGARTKIKAVKNKLSAPFRECEIDLLFDAGYDQVRSVFEVAVAAGIIQKSGAWFSFNGEQIGQGKANAVQYIIDHNLRGALQEAIKNAGSN